jgi:hypothetical protein
MLSNGIETPQHTASQRSESVSQPHVAAWASGLSLSSSKSIYTTHSTAQTMRRAAAAAKRGSGTAAGPKAAAAARPAHPVLSGAAAHWRSELFVKAPATDVKGLLVPHRINVVNKQPDEDLLGALSALRGAHPAVDCCLHYSLVGFGVFFT